MKKKLRLNDFEVQSFVTEVGEPTALTLKAGYLSKTYPLGSNTFSGPPYRVTLAPDLPDCVPIDCC